jgi:double-stranded uracil-DNA glycosylase
LEIGALASKKMKPIPASGTLVSSTLTVDRQLQATGLPDVLSRSLKVVFCGINPGMGSAVVGLHFANRSNRFWRVLHLAGFTSRQLDPREARLLLEYGYGLTTAVALPTIGAKDLSRSDYLAARPAFERKIAKFRPTFLAFLGKPALSAFLNQRNLAWGLQPTAIGGSSVWVLPNPSGLNRAFSISMLTDAYRELFDALAIPSRPSTGN